MEQWCNPETSYIHDDLSTVEIGHDFGLNEIEINSSSPAVLSENESLVSSDPMDGLTYYPPGAENSQQTGEEHTNTIAEAIDEVFPTHQDESADAERHYPLRQRQPVMRFEAGMMACEGIKAPQK